jgi:hypothetical protein
MKNGHGSADKDRVGKEISDKPMKGPGTEPEVSAMIGGVANKHPTNQDESKPGGGGSTMSGGKRPAKDSIAPYSEGGFRNAAMEHKRG